MQLGDVRRHSRLVSIFDQLLAHPTSGRVSAAFHEQKHRTAAYRFLHCRGFCARELHNGIALCTAARLTALAPARRDRVVVALDRCALNLSSTSAGLNPLQSDQCGAGLWLLNAVAIQTDALLPIGLLTQLITERPKVSVSETMNRYQAHARPWHEKESYHWKIAIEDCLATLHSGGLKQFRPNFVIDREGDIAELFDWVRDQPCDLTVRLREKTRRELGSGLRIDQAMAAHSAEAQYSLYLPRQKRRAHVEVAFAPLSYQVFERLISGHRKPTGSLHLWMVHVREVNPPADVEAVEWMLWTTQCVETIEEALELVRDYNARWMIERVHHGLKQVYKLEQTQLRTRSALERWIHILTEAAVQLERVMKRSREEPEIAAIEEVSVEAVYAVMMAQPKAPNPETLKQLEEATLGEFTLWLALLGGYVNQKNQGPPGHIVLSRGWVLVQGLMQAIEIGRLSLPK